MHPFSILTLAIFVAGYITARWDLVTRLYELAIFAVDHGVLTRTLKGFAILSFAFFLFILPLERLAAWESTAVGATKAPRLLLIVERDGTMVPANGLLRIFWPSDSLRCKDGGTILGWRNSDLDIFVVSILQDAEPRRVDNALRVGTLFRGCPHPLSQLLQLCGHATLQVLGSLNLDPPKDHVDPSWVSAYTSGTSLFPSFRSPFDRTPAIQVVLFDRPSPARMQYMSLLPMSLALGDKMLGSDSTTWKLGLDEDSQREGIRKSKLIDKIRLHTVVIHPPTPKELLLPTILNQINCSYEMAQLLTKNAPLLRTREKRSLSVGERVVESAATMWDYFFDMVWRFLVTWCYPLLTRGFVIGLVGHRIIAEVILRVLEWRLHADSLAMKDVLATAQQVDIRLQQFCYWPIQYLTLRKRKDEWESITDRHPEYIRFYNSLWLVANDVIIGIAIGSYIIDNAEWVAFQINIVLSEWTVGGLRDMIVWLTDAPAGFKLNNELAVFLGALFVWVIDYWKECVSNLRPYLPHVVYFIGFSSFAGATMPISLFSDLLSVLTIHIYCFYTASARIFHWQLTIIVSLFHLFRGKKHNVLRNRIDSCDYDLDQLLLGTILFTLLSFLLPTIIVFYLTFTSARMGIIFMKAALDTLLACLNHFPLFALMLRFKDSRRLPGGICFELQDTPRAVLRTANPREFPPCSYVLLKSVPLSLRAMFAQYFQLGDRLRKHYLSPSVVYCLSTGQFVPPLHRKSLYSLQYSMLPAQRAGISDLWRRLTETAPSAAHDPVKVPNSTLLHSGHRPKKP
ncbi:MAG: hypothetical protein Q9169_000594 [Polycauliona sp. 2 TL-2023]